MKTFLKITLTSIQSFIFVIGLIAQTDYKDRQVDLSTAIPEGVTSVEQTEITPEILSLQNKQWEAKKSGNVSEIEKLQFEIDKLAGTVSEKGVDPVQIKTIEENEQMDWTNTSMVTKVRTVGRVRGYATASEQRGANLGRIWAVTHGYHDVFVRDSILIYYSDNGLNWNLYLKYGLPLNELISYDEIDCEIIENNPGEKYLYVVYGVRNQSTNKYFIKMSVTRIFPTGFTSFFNLSWPGDVSTNKYFRPRITSDNAVYTGSAYVYISSILDSAGITGRRSCTKVAQILSPYTYSPSISYRPKALLFTYFYPVSSAGHFTDLAYYDDATTGTESVMFTESNAGSNRALINLYKSSVSNFLLSSSFVAGLQPTADLRSYAYISSSGLSTELLIVNTEISGANHNVQYFKTTNSGTNFSSGYMQQGAGICSRPDIVTKRNSQEHFISWSKESGGGFIEVIVDKFWFWRYTMLNDSSSNLIIGPKAGYSASLSKNYYALWSENYGSDINDVWFSMDHIKDYELKAKNFTYVSPNELQFDIYLKKFSSGAIEYCLSQHFILINTSFANGGTMSYTKVSDSEGNLISDLPACITSQNVPTEARNDGMGTTHLKILGEVPRCRGIYVSNLSPGTRIYRMSLKTTASNFSSEIPNLRWKSSVVPGFSTSIVVFDNDLGVNITDTTKHFIEYSSVTVGMFIEGRSSGAMNFNSSSLQMSGDTVTYYLKYPQAPYLTADSSKTFVWNNGVSHPVFNNPQLGGSYYIVIKHRNSIETWSKFPVAYSTNMTYNFYTSASQAFGNNMKQIIDQGDTVYALYSGDVNQDGSVDVSDLIDIFNDAANFVSGYVVTDVTGDDFVDSSDLLLTFNNSTNFVSVITP
ncbi:MAG: hypothetical protein SGI89_08815 [bacterium]|nr:hypothetical protein [bacterium]